MLEVRSNLLAAGVTAVMLWLSSFEVYSWELQLESGPDRVAMLELFSSQGCSSCPPAEQWLSQLKEHPLLWKRIVPVAFHVDYWDNLGWKDTFASLQHSQRQRRYKLYGRCKAVYTPGFVLAGSEWREWFQSRELPSLEGDISGNLKVSIDSAQIRARFVRAADNRGMLLNVAILGFDMVTPVHRGENRGRQIAQDFVVLSHHTHSSDDGMWKVATPSVSGEGKRAIALWVSYGSDPTPLQAVGSWLSGKGS